MGPPAAVNLGLGMNTLSRLVMTPFIFVKSGCYTRKCKFTALVT
jgi:hypothetical protein